MDMIDSIERIHVSTLDRATVIRSFVEHSHPGLMWKHIIIGDDLGDTLIFSLFSGFRAMWE